MTGPRRNRRRQSRLAGVIATAVAAVVLPLGISDGAELEPTHRDVVIQVSAKAEPDAVARLRAAVGAERIRRVPTLESEIWQVPEAGSAEALQRALQIPGITAADYAGDDYRSLFLTMNPSATLSPAQTSALNGFARHVD